MTPEEIKAMLTEAALLAARAHSRAVIEASFGPLLFMIQRLHAKGILQDHELNALVLGTEQEEPQSDEGRELFGSIAISLLRS